MSRRAVQVGSLIVGGGAPVRVESMLSVPLTDEAACLEQLQSLAAHGAELVRVALPNRGLEGALSRLVQNSPLPLMADLHFDPLLVEAAVRAGVGAVRLNPGNMGHLERLKKVIGLTLEAGVAVRVGANGGSLSRAQIEQAHGDRAVALADAVSRQIELLLAEGQEQLILSAKCTDVRESLRANMILHRRFGDWPFHIGITESGWGADGLVKSAAGIGALLLSGIGDTLRFSLSQPVEDEVDAGYALLRALDLRHRGARLISCPTCGRKQLDTLQLVPLVQPLLSRLPDGFTLAVMGCEVNGPGEARDADLGVAGTPAGLILFHKGQVVQRCSRENLFDCLLAWAEKIQSERR